MQITINTTADQDAAISRLNLQSNAGAEKPPADDVFALSLVTDYLDGLIAKLKADDLTALKQAIDANADSLTTDAIAQLADSVQTAAQVVKVNPLPPQPSPVSIATP